MSDQTGRPGHESDPSNAEGFDDSKLGDGRAEEGLDHLQAAAQEMISAARAFLDVAEELVTDRAKVASVMGAVTSVADGVARAARGGSPKSDDPDGPSSGPVQHIRVS